MHANRSSGESPVNVMTASREKPYLHPNNPDSSPDGSTDGPGNLPPPGLNLSFSQYGEDMAILGLLKNRDCGEWGGFYIDIGAQHPWVCSRTALLYNFREWNGINITSSDSQLLQFDLHRPKDVNIANPLIKQTDTNGSSGAHKPLEQIFHERFSHGAAAGFMSISANGAELRVLQSNNWDKYRPCILAVDMQSTDSTSQYLAALEYQLVMRYPASSIFMTTA